MLKDMHGNDMLEPAQVFVCKQAVALTPEFDISIGKPLRKLEQGEALDLCGEEKTDEKNGMTRCQVKARSDGSTGWVTRRGNQGTEYLEESSKHRVCKAAIPLEQRFESGSALVKTLEPGDLLEVKDGPRTQTKEGASRLQGRNLADGAVGWFNGPSDVTVPWAPLHRCRQSTLLTDGLEVTNVGRTLRKLEPNEMVEALDTPAVAQATGLLRVRVRAERDGVCGFATVRSTQGVTFLEPVTSER